MIEFTSEAIWSWAFVCWEVFDDLFNFLTSICSVHDWVLGDCMFLGIYSFPLGCPICWHIIVHGSLLQSFGFLCYCLLFHFWLESSLFFLESLAIGLSFLLIFSKNQLLLFCLFLFDLFPLWSLSILSFC